mmetsp:Transcript_14928/g.38342  ORF Transcript_14928/g.38342 Transcript_14928/m.38342 type:complete len:106 (+) Transcript_14928:2408-2725(+)
MPWLEGATLPDSAVASSCAPKQMPCGDKEVSPQCYTPLMVRRLRLLTVGRVGDDWGRVYGAWGPGVGVGGHKYLLLAGVSLYNYLAASHDPILIFVRIILAPRKD